MRSCNLRPAYHALWLLLAPAAFAAPMELRLAGGNAEDVAGTVVALRSTDAGRPLAAPLRAVMDQVDQQFVPHVLVVPRGSSVSFPNSDKVRHQVYSFSAIKRFELPLYSGTPPAPESFPISGVATLGCNIHDRMRAYVYVVDAQYYGRTDPNGLLKLADVQPGEYSVTIWHPRSRSAAPILEQKISVGAGGAPVELRLLAPLKLRPASQVPANWDAY